MAFYSEYTHVAKTPEMRATSEIAIDRVGNNIDKPAKTAGKQSRVTPLSTLLRNTEAGRGDVMLLVPLPWPPSARRRHCDKAVMQQLG